MVGLFNTWLGNMFRWHHRDLLRYVSRLVGDRDSAEEVVQNTYVRLAGLSGRPVVIEHPKAYMFSAARNAAVDFTVARNREWMHRVDFDDVDRYAASEDPTHALHRRYRIVRLSVLLNELPVACRTAFVMNKIEGRGHREIAERLGVSISMVEKHIMRALIHCRDLMREDDGV